MAMELIRGLYDYHRWANRRLFEVATNLGDSVTRDMGKALECPTVKGMFAHIYGADSMWLQRWKGGAPARLPGDADFATLVDLRAKWMLRSRAARLRGRPRRGRPRRAGHLPEHPGRPVHGAARAPAPARGQPRHAPPQRACDHDHPHQRLAPDTGIKHLPTTVVKG